MGRYQSIVVPNANTDTIPIVSCVRLGKYNNEKVRPLKIMFTNPQKAMDVLRAYNRKNDLYLNRDLTRRQQNCSYLIRSEFKQRKEQGD